jgi:gamma-glutamylcyclotransferase (GGCT)/AIG2-like uncharacterized protein YtfP
MKEVLERCKSAAFYGTLLEGHGNWAYFLNAPATKKDLTLSGYSMRTFGGYPAIFEADPDSEVKVEVFDMSEFGEGVFESIDHMELGAGYERRLVTLSDSSRAWVYVMPTSRVEYFNIEIPDGSWNTYVRGREAQ